MEDLLRPIYQERASHANTLGILIMEKSKEFSPETDNFDVILLVIVTDGTEPWLVKHYEFEGKSAALHVVEESLLKNWIDTSTYRRAVEWVINGKAIFDRNEYIAMLKEELRTFPQEKRNLKLTIDFARLTRSYSESKDLFASGNYLDAYSRVLRSLHYLGRLAIIEKGYHPEVLVWSQVKRIDPEVFKLYEELINSNEETEKRVELMLLAVEFALNARAKSCCEHLLEIMRSKDEPWSFGELKVHPDVRSYALDLSTLVEYLTSKQILEVIQVETKGQGIYHRKYKVM
ncbi:nucleotidyltransferase-like protein [Aquibacillus koreensis]|uniref:Nucleotidyltransferase-like protein n=1 Tax=Aquibacillus koreensis TaxID=279446 RepID=A0A9X3WMQ5_9BACI|nr:nucleotidyltransferase-like protein [Aquibacillus koreensis]MCT2534358.1 nucleotidyltransferase-like protein [Aquibacillus koreensis]MDC3421665.1 nucleotidyltransferase-like protein [Aquibacillus koreensis]